MTTKNVLVYGRYFTTGTMFVHVLRHLLERYRPQTEGLHFHLVLDDRRDLPQARELLPAERVTVHVQYDAVKPYQPGQAWAPETVDRWESMYGQPHLKMYILMERALEGRPEQTKWDYLFSHIDYFEKLHRLLNPAVFVSGAADGLLPWTAMTVMKANRVPVLSFSPSRFGKRSFILDNPFEVLGIRETYRRLRTEGVPEPERQRAKQLIEEYRNRVVKPVDHVALQGRLKARRLIPNPMSAVRLAKDAWTTDAGNFDLPLRVAWKRALTARRTGLYNRYLASRFTRQIPDGEKFFFFPLHYEPEISLTTQGRGWYKQLELAKAISHALPADRKLYVKEHPSMLPGIRPPSFYRQLLELPGVRLLPQFMNSYDIVPRAEAVLTITGTAGWEALMFGTPVALFGHAFYEEFEDGVTPVDRREELPGILRRLRGQRVDEEHLLAYIAAVFTRTRDGIFVDPRLYPSLAPEGLGEANLDAISRVVLEYL